MVIYCQIDVFHSNNAWFRLTQNENYFAGSSKRSRGGRENLKVLIDRRPLCTTMTSNAPIAPRANALD